MLEINGGKIFRVEEAGLPEGTAITVRDLFFNTPARKKFLKAESTELSHIASLVTHYALAHPDKHFELYSATNAILVAPPVADSGQRVYQVFGKEVLDQLIPVAALQPLERIGLPQPPPWRREEQKGDAGTLSLSTSPIREDLVQEEEKSFGELRAHGFVSRPEIQKLNRNSIYVFVNGRLIRDRLIQHALTEAYRNIIPPSVFPVVLLFLELPSAEVDVNVHPSKTEVRFRQQTAVHDFVRDSVRAALLKPLGQVRESFILAVNHEGLWSIDQHVAHERVLFERVLKQRTVEKVESQRLLMPLIVELTPAQQAVFTEISDELAANGFEVEPFGARSIAVKIAPAGIDAPQIERMLHELLDQLAHAEQAINIEKIRVRIAASIACHAAIKVNMPLEQNKMEWLIAELAKTECPMSCPHGRPVVLRYSLKDIQKAFKRI